jgi:hypothetical protein
VEEYDGRQYVGIDLHRRRSVIVRMTPEGERLGGVVRISSDPVELAEQVASWGESPEVVLEATYGWYWAADVLAAAGARVASYLLCGRLIGHHLGTGQVARATSQRSSTPGCPAASAGNSGCGHTTGARAFLARPCRCW